MSKIRIAIVAHIGMEFYNARIPLVKYLEQRGYEVYAIVPDDEYLSKIQDSGIRTLSYSIKNNSLNPVASLKSIRQITRFCRKYKFEIIHSFSLQPNIYCGFACLFNKKIKVVNHITGLGYAFTTTKFKPLCYRIIILALYQFLWLFANSVIVQNEDDKNILSKLLGVGRKIIKIQGSGVDANFFSMANIDSVALSKIKEELKIEPSHIVCTFVGRLVFEKGIRELLEAAIDVATKNNRIIFLFIGWMDYRNPSCISPEYMADLNKYPNIVFLGERKDVRDILAITDIFVLPTYREGFPRSVLEAMSMKLPVISTNVPGVREAVKDMYNGILVPAKNVGILSNAIYSLSNNKLERVRLGEAGRKLVEQEFNSDVIFDKICGVYDSLG
jgi:N,N'-diacetylbacillosaminyl-diphospho-undecaprenol alpha-1,3-N-acetylgalactosaminyltransferase